MKDKKGTRLSSLFRLESCTSSSTAHDRLHEVEKPNAVLLCGDGTDLMLFVDNNRAKSHNQFLI